jgi:small-conductance mechanosensitive channel
VPNEKLIAESVSHHTFSVPRVSTTVGVVIDYLSDAERALELLLEAARVAGALDTPAPAARVKAFHDHGVEVEVVAWIANPGAGEAEVRSTIFRTLLRRFREEGIRIAVPRRDPLAMAAALDKKDS